MLRRKQTQGQMHCGFGQAQREVLRPACITQLGPCVPALPAHCPPALRPLHSWEICTQLGWCGWYWEPWDLTVAPATLLPTNQPEFVSFQTWSKCRKGQIWPGQTLPRAYPRWILSQEDIKLGLSNRFTTWRQVGGGWASGPLVCPSDRF